MAERQFRRPDKELVYYVHRSDPDAGLIVFDGKNYRLQDDPSASPLVDFRPEEYRQVAHMRYYCCADGEYPWDQWKQWALDDGVDGQLAELGRQTIRVAHEHGWPAELQSECGWGDNGAAMIRLALAQPADAEARWKTLLDTNGGRLDPRAQPPANCDEVWKDL